MFVPDDYVVGKVGEGFTYICEALDLERFAMMPVGPLEKKVEALMRLGARRAARRRAARARPRRAPAASRAPRPKLEVARMLQRRVISAALVEGPRPDARSRRSTSCS